MTRNILFGILGFAILIAGVVTVGLILARDERETLRKIAELFDAGETKQARVHLERLQQRGFETAQLQVDAARLLARIDPEQAAALLEDTLQREDRTAKVMRSGAEVALAMGSRATARLLLEESMRMEPASAEAFRLGGLLNYGAGHWREAVLFFDNAFARMEATGADRILHARALASTGDPDKVIRAKNILLELSENAQRVGADAMLVLASMDNIPLLSGEIDEFLEDFRSHPHFRDSLRGNHEAMRRIIARFEPYDPSFAFEVGKVLVRGDDLTIRDRLSLAFLALRQSAAEEAVAILDAVEGLDRASPEVRALRAYAKMHRQQTTSGLSDIEELLEAQPSSPALLMVMEAILFEHPPPLSLTEREALAELHFQHPLASVAARFRSLDLILEIRPLREEEIFRRAISEFAEDYPEILGEWLFRNGRIEEVLLLTENRSALTAAGWALRLESHLALRRFEELEQEIAEASEKLDDTALSILRAELYFAQDNSASAWRHWEISFEDASLRGNHVLLRRLGHLGVREGSPAQAYRAYRRVYLDGGRMSERDWKLFLQLSIEEDTLAKATRIAEHIESTFPGDPSHTNNAAYLNFLRGRNIEMYIQRMEQVVEANPERGTFRMTLALGNLRAGRPREALRLAEETPLDWSEAGASSQAIYAAVLAANDREAFASSLISRIDRARLLDEEWELVSALSNR